MARSSDGLNQKNTIKFIGALLINASLWQDFLGLFVHLNFQKMLRNSIFMIYGLCSNFEAHLSLSSVIINHTLSFYSWLEVKTSVSWKMMSFHHSFFFCMKTNLGFVFFFFPKLNKKNYLLLPGLTANTINDGNPHSPY